MKLERQFDRFWNGLLLTVFLAAPVVALLAYLLPPSVFPDGERMREGILASAVFLWLIVSAYCILCGLAGDGRLDLQRRRKRRHPQTAEERAYAEYRYTVLPDMPPALLRERMTAWVKKTEEAEGCVEIWVDTAEHYALSSESSEDCYGMGAAFSGEDYVLALSLPSAENDYTRAEQKRLIPASLHRAWKEIQMTWETYDIPVNALLIRHEGQLRLYPEGALEFFPRITVLRALVGEAENEQSPAPERAGDDGEKV